MEQKAIIFSDLHAHIYPNFNKDGNRLANCLKVLRLVFKFAAKEGAETILFVGDLYDTQKSIATEVVTDIIVVLTALFSKYPNIKMLAISGNHDHASKNLIGKPAVSALTHLARIFPNNFILLDNEYGEGEVSVWGIPYYEFPEDFNAELQKVSKLAAQSEVKNKILLIHQTPKFIDNPNIPYDTDMHDPLYEPFSAVYCGHIHKHQVLSDKFIVVGSPLHRDLGDEGTEKGILLIKDAEKPAEFEFISTRGLFPEFRRVKASEAGKYPDDYIVEMPEIDEQELRHEAKVEEFNTSVKPAELMENYWKEADGKDTELLKTGLGLL